MRCCLCRSYLGLVAYAQVVLEGRNYLPKERQQLGHDYGCRWAWGQTARLYSLNLKSQPSDQGVLATIELGCVVRNFKRHETVCLTGGWGDETQTPAKFGSKYSPW